MLKTKDMVIIIISIILVSSAIFILLSFNSGTPKEKDSKEETTQKEPKKTNKEKSMELLNYLINNTNFKTIGNNDKSFYNKYKSLELIIYNDNVYSYKNLSKDEINASIFNYINESNIKNIEKKDSNIYGFVQKSYVEDKLKEIYNNKVKVNIGESVINKYDYNFITISNKVYRYVYIVETKGDNYKIKIVNNYGTYSSPRIYPFSMEIVDAKKIDDYILVTSKAVYLKGIELKNNKWTMSVCNSITKNYCNKEIERIEIEKGPFTTINIDNYLETASTIYTVFKEEDNNYYFYKNFINQE